MRPFAVFVPSALLGACNLLSGVGDYRFDGTSGPAAGGSGGMLSATSSATSANGGSGGLMPPADPWAVRFGGPDAQFVSNATVDFAGGVAIAGTLNGSMQVGADMLASAGGSDALIIRLDRDGIPLLARSFGDPDTQYGSTITVDGSGQSWFTGSFRGSVTFDGTTLMSPTNSNVFFARMLPQGDIDVSAHITGGGDAFARYMVEHPSSGLVFGGEYHSSISWAGTQLSTVAADSNAYALHISSASDWLVDFGGAGDQTFSTLLAATDRIYAAGDNSGSIPLGTLGTLTTNGARDAFLLELSLDGLAMRALAFGGLGTDQIYDMALDMDGNLYLTGPFGGPCSVNGTALTHQADLDAYIVKLDPAWNVTWARTFGGAGDQRGKQVAVDGLGRVYLAGDSLGTLDVDGTIYDNPVGIDGFLVELDSDGNVLGSEAFTSPTKVFVSMMDVDSAGTVTVAGHFIDEIDIFGIKLMGESDGFDDIYVARRPPH